MLNCSLRVFNILFVIGLGLVGPVFAGDRGETVSLREYFVDLQPGDTSESFKARRDLNLKRLREQILKSQPLQKNRQTSLTKAVVDRKIMIIQERQFLDNELYQGVASLYQKAVLKFDQGRFSASQKDFETIETLWPDYKQTRDYLQRLKVVTAGLSLKKNTQGDKK